MSIRKLGLSLIVTLGLAAEAHAMDWCGLTLPVGTTILNQNQFCTGLGIKLQSGSRLLGGGYFIDGTGQPSDKPCVRSDGANSILIQDVAIKNCGNNGVEIKNATNPDLTRVTVTNVHSNGILCLNCTGLDAVNVTVNSNAAAGIRIEGGSGNAINQASILSNSNAGVLLLNTVSATVAHATILGNGTWSVEFRGAGTHDSRAAFGSSFNSARFNSGAFNNSALSTLPGWTCTSDGSGHGSNVCQ